MNEDKKKTQKQTFLRKKRRATQQKLARYRMSSLARHSQSQSHTQAARKNLVGKSK